MNRQLEFFSSCDMGDYLIVMDETLKRLFEVEKKSGKSKCITELEDWKPGQGTYYQCAERYNDKIFFFPFIINYAPIIVYYFREQRIEYINLAEKSNLINENYQLVQRVDDSVWIFSVSLDVGLLIFHMDSETVETVETWSPAMAGIKLGIVNDYSKVGMMVEADGKFYQTIVETNMVVEISKEDYGIKLYTLPEEIKLYRSMDYDGRNFWLPDISGNIVEWNPQQGMKNIFYIIDDRKIERKRNAKIVFCGKKYVWMLPYQQDNRIIQMEYQTGNYRFIDIFPDEFIYNPCDIRRMFSQIHKSGDVLDIYPVNGNLVIHIDLENDCLLEQHEIITLPDEWTDEYIIKCDLQNQRESNRIGFTQYMDAFMKTIQCKKQIDHGYMHGRQIWEYFSR